jgi:hypothetical protein
VDNISNGICKKLSYREGALQGLLKELFKKLDLNERKNHKIINSVFISYVLYYRYISHGCINIYTDVYMIK